MESGNQFDENGQIQCFGIFLHFSIYSKTFASVIIITIISIYIALYHALLKALLHKTNEIQGKRIMLEFESEKIYIVLKCLKYVRYGHIILYISII